MKLSAVFGERLRAEAWRRLWLLPFLSLPCLLLLLPLPGQAVPTSPPSASAVPTLAQALAHAMPPKDGLLLTVAAEKVTLPADALLPRDGDPARQIGEVYGRVIQEFGGVSAAAPPSMTVLNTDPGTPNPYDGMPPGDALKLLLAGLSDAQWKTLTGASGLGLSDLTGNTQPALFLALFPAKPVKLYPRRVVDSFGGEDETNLLSLTPEDVRQAHLRLGQRVTLGMPSEDNSNGYFNALGASPGGLVRYELYPGTGGAERDTLFGVKVRAEVPNTPKPADLEYEAKALQARVNLSGIRNVGELVFRIGKAAHLELYADRRYEARSVTVLGSSSARSADLLPALALCVCGTYRKVGPAFVLTDDLMGEGTRQMILSRFVEAADLARQGTLSDAGDALLAAHGLGSLPPLDSAITLSGAQKAEEAQAETQDEYHIPGTGFSSEMPLAKLTPEQQAFARQSVETWNAHQEGISGITADELARSRATLSKKFLLATAPTLLLQTPSISGAILLDDYLSYYNLFTPSDALRARADDARRRKQFLARPPAQSYVPPPVPPPAPPLGPLLKRTPNRAVLARPQTTKDVDALVAAMKAAGLNQLWLDVFSGGKSHLSTSSPDILTEALAQTHGTSIRVFPVLSLLRWGLDAPEDARDRTLLGETSAEADARHDRYEALRFQNQTPEQADKLPPPTDLSVCPVAPVVQEPLLALVRRLAATEGVAGLVLRDTQVSGYDRPDLSLYGVTGSGPLGYTPVLRLAFLRRMHIDPVDLVEGNINAVERAGADARLPDFDDYHVQATMRTEWGRFRAEADLSLLGRLYAAAQSVPAHPVAVWVAQRRSTGRDDWYGLWRGPSAPLPEKPEEVAYGGAQANLAALARGQCRVNFFVSSWSAVDSRADLAYALQSLPPGWDGMVLDLSGSSANPLAAFLPPPAKKSIGQESTAREGERKP